MRHAFSGPRHSRGGSLLSLVAGLSLWSLLGATAAVHYADLHETASLASAQLVRSELASALRLAHYQWLLAGGPDDESVLELDGIRVRFTAGRPSEVLGVAHVPIDTPGRRTQSARLWYLLMSPAPPVIAGDDAHGTGWVMLEPQQCPAAAPHCWAYRDHGSEVALLVHHPSSGDLELISR